MLEFKDDFSQPGPHPLQPFCDVVRANDTLQFCHIIRQYQQHGVGAVEGKVEDCGVNGLVIIDVNVVFHIHHLDWNLESDNLNTKLFNGKMHALCWRHGDDT